MKKLLYAFLLTSFAAQAVIIPVDKSERLVEDELFAYQWGLVNQGQTLIREKDDIHNLPMQGVANKDIGYRSLINNKFSNRPIVAVLDSGVDLTHPELQGNLWKNEAECGKDPKVDNDGNKLAGDCHGWNFTEAMDSDEAKDPSDIDGHGTHIAGIIAAANNGLGMVGVVPNALIMPVKVMKDSDSDSQVSSAESFARGIIYAVDNGADVINMSLGWPRSMETKTLRDAVNYALSQGVVIVAAAGNNNSAEPLFPCAYDGVVCIAASTINGDYAGFSNYGGHVDGVAPGESILGLNPLFLEPDFFAVPGYELRSGTSQAAPFVAGLVAALKARNKEIKIDEVFARIYQAEPNPDKKKYTAGGDITWDIVNQEVTSSVVRPILKRIRQITFRVGSSDTKVAIPVRNFGVLSNEVIVRVESLSKSISIDSETQTIPSLRQGEFKDLLFNVKLNDFSLESSVDIKITIETNGEKRSFLNEIPVARDVTQEAKFKKSTFAFLDKPLPVGAIRNGEINSLLSTVESVIQSDKHEFFMRRILSGDTKKLELTLFSRKGDKYVQAPNLILVNDALNLVNFIRVDLNLDGKEDYLVHTLAEKDGKRFFVFSFYNEELKPLWPSFQDVKLNLDLFLASMNDLSFIKLNHGTLGKILVPAFFTEGQLPLVDQVLTSWDKQDMTRKNRLYYLEPMSDSTLRVRSLTTKVWEEALKTELKSKWFDTVEVEQIMPTSKTDAEKGQIRALVSVGLGTKRQLFIHSFVVGSNTHGAKLPQLVLEPESVDPLLTVDANGLSVNGEVFFNIYDRTRAKLVATRGESQVNEFIFKHETESDLIAGHIASFEKGQNRFTVFQSREELIAVTTGNISKRTTRPKLRYSFLSQKFLSEMYFPVTYKRNGTLSPALYVDSTAMTGNRIYLFEEQNGELVASVRNSIVVPSNCKALNPVYSAHSGTHEFVFLCLEDNAWVIRNYEMN
ncbi:S8 family peptidase [Peredibacter starrii]|uniref:S8 family peptidase n=1 Tax=Peredibacter starrii TaxID=28202 RepID=A0AAX4HKR3_9BACT|nr:S8 family peptidase [Peredibacter starrii]WPU63829.1 S8 family peptidase [Peredibacter starrii]